MGLPSPDAVDDLLLRKIKIMFQSFLQSKTGHRCPHITWDDFVRDLDTQHDVSIDAIGLLIHDTATRTVRPGRSNLALRDEDEGSYASFVRSRIRRLASSRRRATPVGGNIRHQQQEPEDDDQGHRTLFQELLAHSDTSHYPVTQALGSIDSSDEEFGTVSRASRARPRAHSLDTRSLPTYQELWSVVLPGIEFPRERVTSLPTLVQALNDSGYADPQILAGDLRALCTELEMREPSFARSIRRVIRNRSSAANSSRTSEGSSQRGPAVATATRIINSVEPRVITIPADRGQRQDETDVGQESRQERELGRQRGGQGQGRGEDTRTSRRRTQRPQPDDVSLEYLESRRQSQLRAQQHRGNDSSLEEMRNVESENQLALPSSIEEAGTLGGDIAQRSLDLGSTSLLPTSPLQSAETPATSTSHSPGFVGSCPPSDRQQGWSGGESGPSDGAVSTSAPRPLTTAQLAESAVAQARLMRRICPLPSRGAVPQDRTSSFTSR